MIDYGWLVECSLREFIHFYSDSHSSFLALESLSLLRMCLLQIEFEHILTLPQICSRIGFIWQHNRLASERCSRTIVKSHSLVLFVRMLRFNECFEKTLFSFLLGEYTHANLLPSQWQTMWQSVCVVIAPLREEQPDTRLYHWQPGFDIFK